jgi:hypothetical protein
MIGFRFVGFRRAALRFDVLRGFPVFFMSGC